MKTTLAGVDMRHGGQVAPLQDMHLADLLIQLFQHRLKSAIPDHKA